ncbi:esterase FE4-like [Schistocerca piceifrons]|uniref:esterase FE4-like n=1 Tax=Schistocerca piceifrons TaxID=274613 RepID=UPI001F5FA6C2|nr:esterase FE4-like [Schistocerca piceifrons]
MADETVVLKVRQGEMRGRRRRTVWGFPYVSFQGIPYAQPPVGPLRFKPPQPAGDWSGVLDATREGNIAAQMNLTLGKYEGEEDCLFVNVYTPKLPSEGARGLPVMFMVHGGGLSAFSGNEDWFGPDLLIQHGIIMVSFNYRLGVLGFLSTGDNVVPGNMGFKDQVMALRWVRDNISSFGGDPDNITIFGCSAGGWSCHALVLSPMAKGLFRRAIAQSGVATGDGLFSKDVRTRSFLLGEHLGLKTQDSKELVEFLSKQPARLLQESAMLGRTEEDKVRCWIFNFAGALEAPDAEGGAFMTRHPTDIMLSGDFEAVPFIAGVCDFEGSVTATVALVETDMMSNMARNPRLLVPVDLRCSESEKDAVAEEIRRFYFGDRDIGPETDKQLYDLFGDTVFTYAAVRAAKIHSNKSSQPVYFYNFDRPRELVPQGPLMGEAARSNEKFKATSHGADLAFLFRIAMYGEPPEKDSEDGKIAMKMTRLWTNFAKTGKPTDPELDVSWPPFTADDAAYLYVGRQGFSVQRRPFAERVAFWDDLYKRYGG